MKKRAFIVLLSTSIGLFIVSLVFSFGGAAVGFLAAIVEVTECYYALDPNGTKKIWDRNTLKVWFIRKNKLDKYQKLTCFLFWLFFAVATYAFITEMVGKG